MSDQEILDNLAEIISEIQGIDKGVIEPAKSLVDDLEIDSLAMVEIAMAIEEKLNVSIPDEDLKSIVTVGDAVNYIKSHS